MSEKFMLDRKIGFQNTFYTKGINVIIDSIGPSIILRSIVGHFKNDNYSFFFCGPAIKHIRSTLEYKIDRMHICLFFEKVCFICFEKQVVIFYLLFQRIAIKQELTLKHRLLTRNSDCSKCHQTSK